MIVETKVVIIESELIIYFRLQEKNFFPSLQSDAFYLHNVLAEEDRSGFLELGGAFGGEETASPVLGATAVHFRMPS